MRKNISLIKGFNIVIISLIIFACGAMMYIDMLRISLLSDLKDNILVTAASIGEMIDESIRNELNTMQSIAVMLENEQTTDSDALLAAVQKTYSKNKNFLRFGVAGIDGECVTTDQKRFNISKRSYYKDSIKGKVSFSNTIEDVVSKQNINVFSAPIYQKGSISNILFASMKTNELADMLLFDLYDGKGYSAVTDDNGKIIIQTKNQSTVIMPDLDKITYDDDFNISLLKKNTEGVTRFHLKDEEMYLAYHKLDLYNWYVFTVVPTSVVGSRINDFTKMAAITWLILGVLFAGILWYLYWNRMHNNKKMEEIIYFDQVTNHYNYNQFRNYVQAVLNDKHKTEYALLEIDICDFKMFNEFYGYQAGDQLLTLIMELCDKYCSIDEYCTRINADRFVLLLHTQDELEIIRRLDLLISSIKEYTLHMYGLFKLGYKSGIYLIEADDDDVSKCQDHCVYAKNLIKTESNMYYSFFPKSTYEVQLNEKRLESIMYDALEKHEFEVYLQPKISLKDGKVHSAEALVRWRSTLYGMIPPIKFIPMFEKNGFLETLDMYMLESVCRLLKTYESEQRYHIRISVNISRVYIFKPGFVQKVISIIEHYHISPELIEMEITESVIFNRSDDLAVIVNELRNYGFRIAMDDFGSGYSSLNMLKDISIDVMKLDKVFFRSAKQNIERSRKIVSGILAMAKTLQIQTVAEGVEEVADVNFLKQAGCDEIQGFYFSEPLEIRSFNDFLEHNLYGDQNKE